MFPRSAEAEALNRARRDTQWLKVAPVVTVTPKAAPVAPAASKVCACCSKAKPLTMFKAWPKASDGLTSHCTTCATKARRERQRSRQALAPP